MQFVILQLCKICYNEKRMGDINMIFEYDENNLEKFENFKGGEKYIEAKMYFDGLNRFMIGHIPYGGSVGEHVHETNSEVIYVISGNGYVIYDGQREELHK